MNDTNIISGNIPGQVFYNNQVDQSTESRDDFLKLLVAQMSNQDPMSPVDNQEFAAQLAQFSSLEQLQSINGNIKQGVEMDLILTKAINNTLASTIISKQAKAAGDIVIYNESELAEVSFNLAADAKDVTITITDSAGTVVRDIPSGAFREGDHTIEWDGKNNNGETLPKGTYNFSVQATDAVGNDISVTTLIKGIVTGVRYEDGNAVLLIGDAEVSFASVLEIGMDDGS